MTGSVQVNPAALAAMAKILSELSEQVVSAGHELTAASAPELGGTDPSYDLINGVTTHVSSTATWVMTSGSALRALALAAGQAAEAFRATEQQAADRFAAMAAAFDQFDEMYDLMTGPA